MQLGAHQEDPRRRMIGLGAGRAHEMIGLLPPLIEAKISAEIWSPDVPPQPSIALNVSRRGCRQLFEVCRSSSIRTRGPHLEFGRLLDNSLSRLTNRDRHGVEAASGDRV